MKTAEPPAMKTAPAKVAAKKEAVVEEEDEDDLSFFRKLADEE
jgi:hypothetical protein